MPMDSLLSHQYTARATHTLHHLRYRYLANPLETEGEAQPRAAEGNCRRAVQDYYLRISGIFLPPRRIVAPEAFDDPDAVILRFGDDAQPPRLRRGDIVYAENLRNASGSQMRRRREDYATEDDWLWRLHLAVYLGGWDAELTTHLPEGECPDPNAQLLWHATNIEKGTCVWTLEEFRKYYRMVAVKRILEREE